jgi:hypothetical protein
LPSKGGKSRIYIRRINGKTSGKNYGMKMIKEVKADDTNEISTGL